MELCFLSGMTSSELAAWVQAVGSIVAIAAALFISRREVRASVYSKRKSIAAVASLAKMYADEIEKVIGTDDIFRGVQRAHKADYADFIVKSMMAVPLHEVGVHKSIYAFVELRRSFDALVSAVNELHDYLHTEIRREQDINASKSQFDYLLRNSELSRQLDVVRKHVKEIDDACKVISSCVDNSQ